MYIGIDVGGTLVKYGLVTEAGEVIEKHSHPTTKDREGFINDLATIINNYSDNPEIAGVGISMPGVIRKDGYLITAGSLKELDNFDFHTHLLEKINHRYDVVIENDANSVAFAERWIGNAQGIDNYLCLVLGTGVGGGIVINGNIYRGAHGMAGEFGWGIIDRLPLEGNIESSSVNFRSAVVLGLCNNYNYLKTQEDPSFEPINDAKVIFESEDTDPIAALAIQEFITSLSITIINLISNFDPEIVLIGGGISANQYFMNRLEIELTKLEKRHDSIAFLMGKTIAPIAPTRLQNDAGMIGAVYRMHQLVVSNRKSLKGETV